MGCNRCTLFQLAVFVTDVASWHVSAMDSIYIQRLPSSRRLASRYFLSDKSFNQLLHYFYSPNNAISTDSALFFGWIFRFFTGKTHKQELLFQLGSWRRIRFFWIYGWTRITCRHAKRFCLAAIIVLALDFGS